MKELFEIREIYDSIYLANVPKRRYKFDVEYIL